MYTLYLDESGTHSAATYFVLAGLAIFERESFWFASDMEAIQKKYFPDVKDPVEFHVAPLRQSNSDLVPAPFNSITKEKRRELIAEVYQVIRARKGVIFGIAMEKAWCAYGEPYARAFEDITSRFDLFIRRINVQLPPSEQQRGIIAVSESSYRENLEILGARFRGGSTKWGPVRTLAEVPFFLPAKNTRMLQLADFCTNAIYGRYNNGYTRDFDMIAPRFDREDTRIHGLAHLTRDHECQCLACFSKQ
jgi:hypothetical protein